MFGAVKELKKCSLAAVGSVTPISVPATSTSGLQVSLARTQRIKGLSKYV